MSKRRRRRSSRRRKGSCSSKQSVSQCIILKPNKNDKDEVGEKGQSDSLGKEFEDEEKHTNSPKDKRFKYDYHTNVFPSQRYIHTALTNQKENRAVDVDDLEDSSSGVTLHQSQEQPQANPGSGVMKIDCKGSHIKVEICELNTSGVKATFVFSNENGERSETVFKSKSERTGPPDNEQQVPAWTIHSQGTPNFSFTFSSGEPMEAQPDSVCASAHLESFKRDSPHRHWPTHMSGSNGSLEQPPQVNIQRKRKHYGNSYSISQSWDNPPHPREYADAHCQNLEDLILDVASCRIDTPSFKQEECYNKSEHLYCLEVGGGLELEQLSDSGYDPMSMRPSVSTNRSSFTKDFINCQKTKSWLRNNSIATVEHKTCFLLKKRRQTFPRLARATGSLQDHLMNFRESFSSDTSSSLWAHLQTERQGSINTDVDTFAVMRKYNANKVKEQRKKSIRGFRCIDFRRQGRSSIDAVDPGDAGFDQEHCLFSSEPPTDELSQRALEIQVIPPSCCGSEEQIIQSQPSRALLGEFSVSPGEVTKELRPTETDYSPSTITEEVSELPLTSDPVNGASLDTKQEQMDQKAASKELLRPTESSGGEHWAKRRKLFKESKQRSSTGEGSISSDVTEGSVYMSEDGPSLDMTTQDTEEGAFYTETFHSAAWMYQGDAVSPEAYAGSLNSRSRVVSIRERTVRINKGAGEYPWGFRIQFSKPIVVTEVDTNGAAEEAGLIVGDYVLAVNGTDVTSIPHSEAADLARQGPDVLTLTIGSDIARGPNSPRPGCRGYLHKRTQSGFIRGWRKRWFVLTHDCCLHYYRHKRDEGKRLALSTLKLEGAEVGPDLSLGKPFVFKCRPLAGNRVYFFCATSNQEMKRWLEALEKAIHPVTQNHVWVDVTRHNSNLPPLAVKNPECLGLLHKMDKIKDTWVRHYCILKDGCLYLYSGIRATHAHGGIYLQGYTVKEQPYGSRKCTIELKPPSDEFKSFHLCAENPNDNKRWIAAINASIKKWLLLHQALHDYISRPAEETRM